MYLKSPDPTAHAVIGGGRLYPVRSGIFSVPDDQADHFAGYAVADEIPEGVAAELAEEGSHEHLPEEPPADVQPSSSGLSAPSPLDDHVQQLAGELKSVLAEKDALSDEVKRLIDEAEKPFEIVGNDIEGLSIEVDHEARKILVSLEGAPAGEAEEESSSHEDEESPSREELLALSRADLNAKAGDAGVAHPAKLPNKEAVADAILATVEAAAE